MAKYKSFSTSKQKIPYLWELTDKDRDLLIKKENNFNKLFKDKTNLKSSKIIYESEWITVATTDLLKTTKIKGTELPNLLSYDTTINNLNLPDDLLPFIELQLEFLKPDTHKIFSNFVFNNDTPASNYVEVYGDAELIYKGSTPRLLGTLYDISDLNEGQFLETHTKNRFNATILYTDGGDEWKYQPFPGSGSINYIEATYNTSTSCSINEDSDVFIFNKEASNHNIISINGITFTAKGIVTQTRWTNNSITQDYTASVGQTTFILSNAPAHTVSSVSAPNLISYSFNGNNAVTLTLSTPFVGGEAVSISYQYCSVSFNTLVDETVTLNWLDLDNYKIKHTVAQLFKKIAGNFVLQTTAPDLEFDSSMVDSVTSINAQFQGYWLFYDSNTTWEFGIIDDELQGLPTSSTTLPYTQITLQQNVGINLYNRLPSIEMANDIHVLNKSKNLSFVWIKLTNQTNGINIYQIKPQIRLLIVSPANKVSSNSIYNIYNDIYSQESPPYPISYDKTTENHTTDNLTLYETELTDIKFKIKLILNNPFIYFKTKKPNEI